MYGILTSTKKKKILHSKVSLLALSNFSGWLKKKKKHFSGWPKKLCMHGTTRKKSFQFLNLKPYAVGV